MVTLAIPIIISVLLGLCLLAVAGMCLLDVVFIVVTRHQEKRRVLLCCLIMLSLLLAHLISQFAPGREGVACLIELLTSRMFGLVCVVGATWHIERMVATSERLASLDAPASAAESRAVCGNRSNRRRGSFLRLTALFLISCIIGEIVFVIAYHVGGGYFICLFAAFIATCMASNAFMITSIVCVYRAKREVEERLCEYLKTIEASLNASGDYTWASRIREKFLPALTYSLVKCQHLLVLHLGLVFLALFSSTGRAILLIISLVKKKSFLSEVLLACGRGSSQSAVYCSTSSSPSHLYLLLIRLCFVDVLFILIVGYLLYSSSVPMHKVRQSFQFKNICSLCCCCNSFGGTTTRARNDYSMNRSSEGKNFARSSVDDQNPDEREREYRSRRGRGGRETRRHLCVTGSVESKQRSSQQQQRYPTRRVVVVSRGASGVGTITKGGGDSIHSRSWSGSHSGIVSVPLSQSSIPIWSSRAAANIVVNNQSCSSNHDRKSSKSRSRSRLTATSLPVIIERKILKASAAAAAAAVKDEEGRNSDNTHNNCACAGTNKEYRHKYNDKGCNYDNSSGRNIRIQ
mmetsp:Transcript_8914/g.14163  ORF Transcript_8914/g.14163 Transcript_8914/m.14163 type:complete len:575 (+) Transcript_8914:399-2123(+)